ncbi:MAG TPA: aminoacyl--tRNA ligase-related protein [Candidatus Paceibacterota bacterium]
MRQSFLFTKTRREAPTDETTKNAQLLIRAGFVHKEMAGVYSYLPLGLRVLGKIVAIIREEMNAIGGVEIVMTTLQSKEIWEKSGRWSDEVVDNWFKTELKNGEKLGLGFTHDEMIVDILREHIRSYKDLPKILYQIQNKFRNELRAKSGIIRGREFLMKDLYSFHATQAEQDEFYEKCKDAYLRIYTKCGLGDITFVTFASGGTFSKYSHEFQTICDVGEDLIYLDEKKKIAVNKEVFTDEVLSNLGLERNSLIEKKSIEVGNIFKQGTRYPTLGGLTYKNEKGEIQSPVMGGYGIGVNRLMGTVVELLSDEKGIVWPESIAPFSLHLISLDEETKPDAEVLYEKLTKEGKDVLYDNRSASAGEKFADSDLIGIPTRVVVSKKAKLAGGFELKKRGEMEAKIVNNV